MVVGKVVNKEELGGKCIRRRGRRSVREGG